MNALVLSRHDVVEIGNTIDVEHVLSDILIAASSGYAGQSVRQELHVQQMSGLLGLMPSYAADDDPAFGCKVVCVMPKNPSRGLPAHQGVALLFDGDDGHLVGMAEAGAVTEVRTAALAALATRIIGPPGSGLRSLVVGAGHQALPHLQALARLPNVGSHVVWARRHDAAEELAQEARRRGVIASVEPDLEVAVRGADVITMVTGSPEPLIAMSWLKQGAHVNAMGSSTARVREFGTDLIKGARLFVDHRASVLALAGEFVEHQGIDVAELGDVIAKKVQGRHNSSEVTVFKSVGMAIEDLAFLRALFERARATGAGQQVVL